MTPVSVTTGDRKEAEKAVVPDGVEYVEPEVRELARGVAADIRANGHYQKPRVHSASGYCVVTAPTYKSSGDWLHLWRLGSLLCGDREPRSVAHWNDSNPTDVVLARLDAIAEGLVSA